MTCMLCCSMIGRRDHFKPARAAYLLNSLFAWLLLEAHDKGCVDRIFGPVAGLQNSTTETHSSPGGGAPGHAASTTHSIWALGAWAFRQAQQLLQLPLQQLLGTQAGSDAPAAVTLAQLVARSGWKGAIVEGTPRQLDESSCGVFMSAFATQVLTGHAPPYDMTQADVPALRTAIAATLLGVSSAPPLGAAAHHFSTPRRGSWWPWG